MTRYTVSPPMLIEKIEREKPKEYVYYHFGKAANDNYLTEMKAYEQHLSSLQQIRMSDDLVKWCEENKKVELDEGEFEVKGVKEWSEKLMSDYYLPTAFPVEVVDEDVWEEMLDYLQCQVQRSRSGEIFIGISKEVEDYLKSHYKLTKL